MQRAAQIWMSGHLAASALIKRAGPCDKTVIGPASAENGLGSAARADTEAFVQNGQPQPFFQLSWLALQKPCAREICARMMTGRKFLSPPRLWLAPQSDHGSAACAETEAFFQYGPPQSFFELSWLALQEARAREVAQRLMTGRKFLSPPLLWLAPQSDHGSAARAETEAFFQYGPPQSFFLARPTKARREVRKFLSPPLLWLAPQSDHGSAACAETEAFFQYGPPQSFFELSWLALQKARAREVAQRLMTGRKFLPPPLLWLAPQSDHGSAACAETEAFFQDGNKNARGKLAQR